MKIEIIELDNRKVIDANNKKTLLDILREEGFNVQALCNGNGTCGKCKVEILSQVPDATSTEKNFLGENEIHNGIRLACMHKPKDGMIIKIEEKKDYKVVSDFDINKINISKKNLTKKKYGIAVDIGTTTVAIALVDIDGKKIIDVKTFLNPQQQYGADVISRIDYVNNNKSDVLTNIIRNDIDKAIMTCCSVNKINTIDIDSVVVVGNTTMLYILQKYNPHELAVSPFIATHKDMKIYNYNDLFSEFLDCKVILLPCISAYIGADITSGIFFLGQEILNNKALFLDLGTNGEIVLSNGNNIYCASAAAGPAFEGATIKCGVGSVDGAICNVKIEGDRIKYNTISDKQPIGICGSGIIDIVAEGIKNLLIDDTGRLENKEIKITNTSNPIIFNQKDVREVQLAKAAIFSGIQVLLDEANINLYDVEKFYLAGGFGKHVDIENSCLVGIIPKELKNKTEILGNTSLGGAVKYLLTYDSKDSVYNIIDKCSYVELSMDIRFNNYFINNMNFR